MVRRLVSDGLLRVALLAGGLAAGGCMLQQVDLKAKPATSIDPNLSLSEYWFSLPAGEQIESADYDSLWNACELALHDGSFVMERFDYRTGLLTSQPLVSKQFYELWKNDVVSFNDAVLANAATRRRVAHFQINRLPNGRFSCEVKVVVEHYSMIERRITAVNQYQNAFSVHRQYEDDRNDDGTPLRAEYWYAERRDPLLEHSLADRVREHLKQQVAQTSNP